MKQTPSFYLSKFRVLKPDERIREGDIWYDFDDEKWWEFHIVGHSRKASEYPVVVRLK